MPNHAKPWTPQPKTLAGEIIDVDLEQAGPRDAEAPAVGPISDHDVLRRFVMLVDGHIATCRTLDQVERGPGDVVSVQTGPTIPFRPGRGVHQLRRRNLRREIRDMIPAVVEAVSRRGGDPRGVLLVDHHLGHSGDGPAGFVEAWPAIKVELTLLATAGDAPAMNEQAANPRSPRPPDDMHVSDAQLATIFGLSIDAVRARTKRWRATHYDGWTEVADRKPREAKYLYRFGDIRAVFDSPMATSE